MAYRPRERGRTPADHTPPSPPKPARRAAVLYARVSSRDQEKEGYSIPAQQKLLREYAQANNLLIVEEFVDVETAKRAGRTNFVKMLAYVRKRHQNPPVVLVEKTDRLYRNLKDWVTVDEMKTEIHLVKENVVISEDSRSSEKFMHGIKVLMAKNYVDNLSEEVKKGMFQKAEEGYWPSRAPFGYLNRRDGDKSFLVVDPDRAVMLQNLFRLYDAGTHSLKDLAAYAEQHGLLGRRGGKMSPGAIHWILRNPIYMGEFDFGGRRFRSKDPVLVTRELWQRVQDRLDGHPDTRPGPRNALYQGLMTCGHCGAAITAEVHGGGKYVYYRCAQVCRKEKYVREEVIAEMLAERVVKSLVLLPGTYEAAAKALKASRADVARETTVRLADARGRYDRFRRLIDKAYEDKLEGRVDSAYFERKRAEWEEGMYAAHEEVERLARVDHQVLDTGLEVLELVKSAYDLYKRRTPSEQRKLLDMLLLKCDLRSGELVATFREPFDYLANIAAAQNDDGAESPSGDPRRPVWWAILDLNQ